MRHVCDALATLQRSARVEYVNLQGFTLACRVLKSGMMFDLQIKAIAWPTVRGLENRKAGLCSVQFANGDWLTFSRRDSRSEWRCR